MDWPAETDKARPPRVMTGPGLRIAVAATSVPRATWLEELTFILRALSRDLFVGIFITSSGPRRTRLALMGAVKLPHLGVAQTSPEGGWGGDGGTAFGRT